MILMFITLHTIILHLMKYIQLKTSKKIPKDLHLIQISMNLMHLEQLKQVSMISNLTTPPLSIVILLTTALILLKKVQIAT